MRRTCAEAAIDASSSNWRGAVLMSAERVMLPMRNAHDDSGSIVAGMSAPRALMLNDPPAAEGDTQAVTSLLSRSRRCWERGSRPAERLCRR